MLNIHICDDEKTFLEKVQAILDSFAQDQQIQINVSVTSSLQELEAYIFSDRNKPDILFLDEPCKSLDEEGVERIRRIILEEKERGALILLASHMREDIDYLADTVYEVKEGRVSQRQV